MGKYTADDNRSMQLNDNNDRYYSSRGIDRDDLFEDEEYETTILEEQIMLLEFGNQIINTQRITRIEPQLLNLTLNKGYKGRIAVYPTVRINLYVYDVGLLTMDFTPEITDRDHEDLLSCKSEYNPPDYSRYLPVHDSYNVYNPRPACFDPDEAINWRADPNKKIPSSEEEIKEDINKTLGVYARFVFKCMIEQQKQQLGG
jgi:hypothetical protein